MPRTELQDNRRIGARLCQELERCGYAKRARVRESGENVCADLRIEVDRTEVSVELTGYYCSAPFKLSLVGDEQACATLEKSVVHHLGTALGLEYHRDIRPFRQRSGAVEPGTFFEVPRAGQREAVASELDRLLTNLKRLPKWAGVDCIEVWFGDPDMRALNREPPGDAAPGFWVMDESAYPWLARFYRRVLVRRTSLPTPPVVRTDLHTLPIVGDAYEVAALVAQKVDKLSEYRRRAVGAPCWLVLHSADHPLSRLVHRTRIPEMCAAARARLGSGPSSFDAAFWLHDGVSLGDQRLFPILEPAAAVPV